MSALRVHASCVVVALTFWSAVSSAGSASSEEAEAEALFKLGVEMGRQERWGEAERYFARSNEIVARPSTSYNRVLSLFRLGQFVAVLEEASRFFQFPEPARRAEASAQVQALSERAEGMLATAFFDVAPANAELVVDGRTLPGGERRWRVDPGDHTVVATAAGHAPAKATFNVIAGEKRRVVLKLEPEPTEGLPHQHEDVSPSSDRRAGPSGEVSTIPYALLIGGGSVFAAGAVVGTVVYFKNRDLDERCPGGRCSADEDIEDQHSLERLALTADILYGVGVAAAGTGLVWLLLESNHAPSDTARLRPGLGVGPSGVFMSMGRDF